MALSVSIVSRDGSHWEGEARHVRVPTVNGAVGILSGRQPLLAALAPGDVVIDPVNGEQYTYHVESGFVSLDSDVLTLAIDNRHRDRQG